MKSPRPALPIVRVPVYFCSSVLSPPHLGTPVRTSGPRLAGGSGGGGGGGGKGRAGRLDRLDRHTPVWRKAWQDKIIINREINISDKYQHGKFHRRDR